MKSWIKRGVFVAALLAAGTGFALKVKAGAFAPQAVLLGASFAQGSLVSARQSADANQSIGCRVNTFSGGSQTGQCFATDSAGNTRTCMVPSGSQPVMFETIKGINQVSFLRFEFPSSGSNCTRIDILNGSNYTNF